MNGTSAEFGASMEERFSSLIKRLFNSICSIYVAVQTLGEGGRGLSETYKEREKPYFIDKNQQ